jgi:hypothetical protein
MTLTAFSMHYLLLWNSEFTDTTRLIRLGMFHISCLSVFGMIMIILTYFGLKEDAGSGTKVAALVFHVFLWILAVPSVFYNFRTSYFIATSKTFSIY